MYLMVLASKKKKKKKIKSTSAVNIDHGGLGGHKDQGQPRSGHFIESNLGNVGH